MALQILYQMDFVELPAQKAIDLFCAHFASEDLDCEFISRLVEGVLSHKEKIDQIVSDLSERWRINRMCTTDRNIIRLAAFEIIYCPDIPPKVSSVRRWRSGSGSARRSRGPLSTGYCMPF